jgi:hypothetical protein
MPARHDGSIPVVYRCEHTLEIGTFHASTQELPTTIVTKQISSPYLLVSD